MLKYFKCKNFKGFKEEIKLDLSKNREYEFNKDVVENGILTKSLIYGENGAGKSNLGFAIFDIISTITDKNKNEEFYKNYINIESEEKIAEFEYCFDFEGNEVKYIYRKLDLEKVIYEKLQINNIKVIEFDLKNSKEIYVDLEGAENLDKDITGLEISSVKYVLKNTKLSENLINKTLKEFKDFVDRMLFFRSLDRNNYIGFKTGSGSILGGIVEKGKKNEFEDFLNETGLKCTLEEVELEDKKTIHFKFGNKSVPFYEIASTGTKRLALFFYWKMFLDEASFVFMDEYDAFYHMHPSKLIIKKLKENKNQIILTTHNTSLMNNELLRPDSYFIIGNNKIKNLQDSTNKELRKAHNLEKIYRSGGFNE